MSGEETLVDERELAAALRGLAPERAAFREAVERRLRAVEATDEGNRGARELRAADGAWWRRAAAWLPAELAPGAVAGAGAKLSWKALPGLVVLPAVTFAMLVAPVVFALQSFSSQDGPGRERLAAVSSWWRAHRRAGFVTLALLALLFLFEPASAGMALLLVSTGVLALLLARLKAAGFGQRAEVGSRAATLLLVLAVWMGGFTGPWRALFPSERAWQLGFCVLALGAAVCALLALHARYGTPWRALTRSGARDAVLSIAVVLLVPWSAVLLWSAFTVPLRHADHVQQLEASRPGDLATWEQARRATAWYRTLGLEPDLAGLRAHWESRRATDEARMPGFLAAGIDLGFVAPAELATIAAEGRALLHEDGPVRGASLRERADLLALVRSGELTEPERAQLAARLVASHEASTAPWVLARLVTVAGLLDELGRRDLADGLRPAAHRILAQTWVRGHGLFFRRAGFLAPSGAAGTFAYPPHTHDALDLMLRFGVPPGIELGDVAHGLQDSALRRLPWAERRALEDEADLALSKLEGGLLPRTGPLRRIGAHRVLLALAVLVGFCVLATLRAPRAPPA